MTYRRSPHGLRGLAVGLTGPRKWFWGFGGTAIYFGNPTGAPWDVTDTNVRVTTVRTTAYINSKSLLFALANSGLDEPYWESDGIVSVTEGVAIADAWDGAIQPGVTNRYEVVSVFGYDTVIGYYNSNAVTPQPLKQPLWSLYTWRGGDTSTNKKRGVKVIADGVLHWSERSQTLSKLALSDGSKIWSVGGVTVGELIEVDAAGNIYLAGDSTTLRKFNSSGVHQWTRTLAANIRDIAVFPSTGDIAVTYGTGGSFSTAEIDTNGTQAWVRRLATTNATSGGVAFDTAGNVYTLGVVTSTAGYVIAKYSSTGTLDFQRSVRVAASGACIRSSNLTMDSANRMWFTMTAAPTSGETSGYVFRLPTTVPVGTHGDVVIAASSLTATTPADTLTVGSFTAGRAYPPERTRTDAPKEIRVGKPDGLTGTYKPSLEDIYTGITL